MSTARALEHDTAGGGFTLRFGGAGGHERVVPLGQCHGLAWEEATPVRTFRWSRGLGHYPGWWWAASTGRHVGFESWLEQDRLILLDFDPDVVGIAVSGTAVRLADTDGVVTDVGLIDLSAAEDFEVVRASSRAPVPPVTPLEGLPEAVAAEALWWEQHIVEVLRGVPPQAPAGTKPRPEYDPAVVSLTRREQAKATELTAAGRPVTASAITKRRRRYEARGVASHKVFESGCSVLSRSSAGGSW